MNELLNRAGMDSISAGNTVAWAIECYENGIGTPADPRKAKQVLDRWKEMNGVRGLMTLAAERQEEISEPVVGQEEGG